MHTNVGAMSYTDIATTCTDTADYAEPASNETTKQQAALRNKVQQCPVGLQHACRCIRGSLAWAQCLALHAAMPAATVAHISGVKDYDSHCYRVNARIPPVSWTLELPLPLTATEAVATPACFALPATQPKCALNTQELQFSMLCS